MAINRFRVVDVFDVPGRKDRIAVLEVLEGDVDSVVSPLMSPEMSGQWRLTCRAHTEPYENATAAQLARVPIGIEGPMTLTAGIELVEQSS